MTGDTIRQFAGNTETVIDFDIRGDKLATGSEDAKVFIYSLVNE